MNNLTTFYIVRHGEADSNVGIFNTPQWLSPLTKKGEDQAANLAKKLKNIHFDAIFSSNYTRAKGTAETVALERNIEVNTTELIKERSFWEYYEKHLSHLDAENIRNKIANDLQKLNDTKSKMQYKYTQDSESADEGALRLLNFIRETVVAYPNKTILVVSHGNVMRSMLVHLGFCEFDELPNASIENTGYYVLETDGSDIAIKETYGINKQTGKLRTW